MAGPHLPERGIKKKKKGQRKGNSSAEKQRVREHSAGREGAAACRWEHTLCTQGTEEGDDVIVEDHIDERPPRASRKLEPRPEGVSAMSCEGCFQRSLHCTHPGANQQAEKTDTSQWKRNVPACPAGLSSPSSLCSHRGALHLLCSRLACLWNTRLQGELQAFPPSTSDQSAGESQVPRMAGARAGGLGLLETCLD